MPDNHSGTLDQDGEKQVPRFLLKPITIVSPHSGQMTEDKTVEMSEEEIENA
ncbi:hypothetical protein YC2023_080968 [Brassica napus]